MNAASAPAVTPELTVVDEDLGSDVASVVRALAGRLHAAGRVTEPDALVEAILAREEVGTTALPGGIAIPHARSASVTTPSLAAARLPEPITWSASTDPTRVVLLIAAPGDDSPGYLGLLQKVATACVKKAFIDDAARAETSAELAEVLGTAIHQR